MTENELEQKKADLLSLLSNQPPYDANTYAE